MKEPDNEKTYDPVAQAKQTAENTIRKLQKEISFLTFASNEVINANFHLSMALRQISDDLHIIAAKLTSIT